MKLPMWVTFDCYDTLVEFPNDRVPRELPGARADGIDVDGFLFAYAPRSLGCEPDDILHVAKRFSLLL